MAVENVDVRICRAEKFWRDGEEKSARLELVIIDSPIDCLKCLIADGKNAIADNVSFLLRENCANSCGPDLRYCLNAVVPAGNSGGDEAGDRRLKGDVSNLQSLQEFLALSFVVDRDVIRSVELTLRIVVHIHVHALGDNASGARVELKIEERLERAAAVEYGINK